MSICTECLLPMDKWEAQQYEACQTCRRGKEGFRVRTLYRKGTEEIGRPARPLSVIYGSCELNRNGDES